MTTTGEKTSNLTSSVSRSLKATIPMLGRQKRVKVVALRKELRTAPLAQRVRLEREGIPFMIVKDLISELEVSTADFQRMVRIPKATFTKKMKDKTLFSGVQGQSVIGILELINRVEDMIDANPATKATRDFDVEKWVGEWVAKPQPALGGMAPAELMDTPSGRESVMRVLGAIQSGSYQ